MSSPAGPFATAQDAALRGSDALSTAMGLEGARIYVEVPANAALPYVVIGEDQVLLETSGCAAEAEIFATVNLWSRPMDKGVQARAMGSAIIAVLNAELSIDGWDVDDWELQSEDYSSDPDQSVHGRLVFHYMLTEQLVTSDA